MKKVLKKIVTLAIALFLILSVSTVKASDDEEPKFPNGANIPKNISFTIH